MDSWLGNKKRILVLNREDMITTADRNAWASYFASQGTKVIFSNGQLGMVPKQEILFQLSLVWKSNRMYLFLCGNYRAL
jgi:hypothetical protein